jgi:hypothetical protein
VPGIAEEAALVLEGRALPDDGSLEIDLVFFVNGLPVATVELKTDFTQSLDEAVNQYRKDRHPVTNGRPEPLLSFGHRALVHFAVSNDLAAMTTRLEGENPMYVANPFGRATYVSQPATTGIRTSLSVVGRTSSRSRRRLMRPSASWTTESALPLSISRRPVPRRLPSAMRMPLTVRLAPDSASMTR